MACTALNPDGAVLVDGELWVARSVKGRLIADATKVQVTGSVNHTLLVTPHTA